MRQVKEAVTTAATLLARLKRDVALDERDRDACKHCQQMLEDAEKVLYDEVKPEQ